MADIYNDVILIIARHIAVELGIVPSNNSIRTCETAAEKMVLCMFVDQRTT